MNPFKLIRKRLRLAQSGIPGLSSTTVQRIEGGQYEELSEGMIQALVLAVESRGLDFSEISNDLNDRFGTPYLTEAYQRWREQRRKQFGDAARWPDLREVDALTSPATSPMHAFVEELAGTMYRFCHRLCLQEPTVDRYARGVYRYSEPPQALEEALAQAGYTDRDKLFARQRKWIDSVKRGS